MSIGHLDLVLQMWREADGGGDCSQQDLSLSDLIRLCSSCRLPFLILYIYGCVCACEHRSPRGQRQLILQSLWYSSGESPNMASGYSGLLRDQYPLLTTKPLLQPEILHCRLAFLLSAQTQHGRWASRAAVRATVSERKRKHAEICSTKWKRFSFISKP